MEISSNKKNKFKFLSVANLVYLYSFDCCESTIIDPIPSQEIETSTPHKKEPNNKHEENFFNREPNKIKPFFKPSPLKKKLNNQSNDTNDNKNIVSTQKEIETALCFLSLSGIVNSSKLKSTNLSEAPFIKNISKTIIELYEIIEKNENIESDHINHLLRFLDKINSENQDVETKINLPDLVILLSLEMIQSASKDCTSEIENRIKTIKNCKTCKTIINIEEKDDNIIHLLINSENSHSKRNKNIKEDDVCKKCSNPVESDNHLLSVSKNILAKFENPTKIKNEFPIHIEKNDRKKYFLKYGIVEFPTANGKQLTVISRNDINEKWMIHKNNNSIEHSISTESMELKYAVYSMKD